MALCTFGTPEPLGRPAEGRLLDAANAEVKAGTIEEAAGKLLLAKAEVSACASELAWGIPDAAGIKLPAICEAAGRSLFATADESAGRAD